MSRSAAQPPLSPQSVADLLCTLIVLCRGRDARQRPIWAYLCMKPSMAAPFKAAREKGNLDIADYGTVIESGDGENPPEGVMRRMERDFGVNHMFEQQLLDFAAVSASA